MKSVFKWFIIILGMLLLIMLALPVLFKDKIIKTFDEALKKHIQAQVYYDTEKFSLSLFKNFPNLTLGVSDFGIVGVQDFAGDTLIHVSNFDFVIDLGSVIFGPSITVEKIGLDGLKLQAIVLRSGKSNFDILIADTTQKAEEAPAEPADFSIKIRSWFLKNSNIRYFDRQQNIVLNIEGLNHTGSGDFTQDIVDLKTQTSIASISVQKDSVHYLSKKRLEAALELNSNLKEGKYTFGKNKIQLNDFAVHFEGMIHPKANGQIEMDVKCHTDNTDFKSLLSLVPGIYTQSFNDIKTKGTFSFSALAKGVYDSLRIPDFDVQLLVNNASFQYPQLPTPVEKIIIDFKTTCEGGNIENAVIMLRKGSFMIGKDPFEAACTIKGLKQMDVDAMLNAKITLEALTSAFPVPDLTLKGLIAANIRANGTFDQNKKLFPVMQAKFDWNDGYIKSTAFPQPIEKIQMHLQALNEGGSTEKTVVNVEHFDFVLDGEPFTMAANMRNLDNITYQAKAKGTIDLEKMTKIFPQPGMTLKGRIKADISTAGQMNDIQAGKYDKLPTSGVLEMQQFYFSSTDYPQGISMQSAYMTFNPREMKISNLKGKLGKSDMEVEGSVSNYLAYFMNNETLKGNLRFTSKMLDANEWIPAEESTPENKSTQTETEPIQVPSNLDLQFSANIGELKYSNMLMKDFKGTITVKNGIVSMDQLKFDMLGGSVDAKGTFSTQNPDQPAFSFNLNLKNLSVSEAYKTFYTIQILAPIAQKLDGKFSTSFSFNGKTGKDLSPDLSTLDGQGLVNLVQGMLKDFTLAKGINGLTKSNLPTDIPLKDILVKAKIDKGKLYFEPFTIQAGNVPFTISGSNSLDGSIDYLVKTSIPGGAASAMAATYLSKLTGTNLNNPEKINVDVKVGGTHTSPKYSIARVDAGGAGQQAKQAAQQQLNQAKAEAEAKARAEAERLAKEAQEKAEAARREAEQRAKEEAEKAKNQVKEKANEELNKLKDRFKKP